MDIFIDVLSRQLWLSQIAFEWTDELHYSTENHGMGLFSKPQWQRYLID